MAMETKDIVVVVLAAVGAITGAGNTVYESKFEPVAVDYSAEIQQLEDEITSQRIQICLLINEINRQADRDGLQQCTL